MDKPWRRGLFSEEDLANEDDRRIMINGRCQLLISGRERTVMALGVAIAHFRAGDRMGEAYAMVSLMDLGHARQNEVARAFGCSDRSVRRYQQRFEEGGLAALGRPDGYPEGRPRLKVSRDREVERLKAEGCSNRWIARHLSVDEKAIRKQLKRLGWKGVAAQTQLPGLEADADPNLSDELDRGLINAASKRCVEPLRTEVSPAQGADFNLSGVHPKEPETESAFSFSLDTDPRHRVMDRMLACNGLISDALPLFAPGQAVPCAGVLLAVPMILASGILVCADEVYGGIGPAFYGLRTTLMTFLLMSLLRIKSPENLKESCPQELGRILGLDRVMEMKTLRAKLARLAGFGRAAEFGRAVAKRRMEVDGAPLGFLYVDGHVRVYSGKQELPKAHVTRLRISLPATTDYFANDERGDPLFVITASANAGLTKMLPTMLSQAKELIPGRRLTVVFDRGGYSFDLFKQIIANEADILTYRKGTHEPAPSEVFRECTFTNGRKTYTYHLADEEVTLCEGLVLRQITRLCEKEHQTTILTSRRDLPAPELAFRMFERWRQENFFKYMRQEFALDALVDYGTEPDDAMREVPNPVWRELDSQFRQAKAGLNKQCARLGLNVVLDKENLRQFLKSKKGKKADQSILESNFINAARRVMDLQKARDAVPRRVPVAQVAKDDVRKLDCERKHLTTVLKMAAYRIESDLFRMLEPFYTRHEDEGRTLIQTAFNNSADLEITATELRITIAPLSSPHRTKAIACLCHELNKTPVRYPGTSLTIRYFVAGQNLKTGQV